MLDANRKRHLDQLQTKLGYQFSDITLLELALTHRSLGANNNERLEFLGDSILNFVAATQLFNRCDDSSEGHMSRLRASLVKGTTLTKIAKELELSELIQLGAGELKSGGHKRASILADAVEAILGAIFQDSGYEQARDVTIRLLASRLDDLPSAEDLKDPKTRLQEWLQSRGEPLPGYKLVDSYGQAHEQTFVVDCELKKRRISKQGEGSSRRRAEQAAAKLVYNELEPQS